MTAILQELWRDEAGLILSAELVIILTIGVLGMIVGLANVQNALLGEFADLGLAFQSLNQSYRTPSYWGCWKIWGRTSWVAGSSFIDLYDGCVANNSFGNGGCEILSGTNCVGTANGCSSTVDSLVPPSPGNPSSTGLQPTPDPTSSSVPLTPGSP